MSELMETRRTLRAGAALLLAAAALSGCIHRYERPASQAQATEEPPPGMAQVDVIDGFDDQTWDVYAGRERVCTTPCTQWVDPLRPISLKARESGDELWIPGMGEEVMEARSGLLVATGSNDCKETHGIIWTSLGGMGGIVGVTLTAIGCSDVAERGGMCTAGLITGGVTLPLTAFGIWLLVDSGPHAEVFPVYRAKPAPGQPPVTVRVSPAGVTGTF